MPSKALRITFLFILLFAVPLFAAKFWETKEYTSWSEKECTELLMKSPWAQSNGFGAVPGTGTSTSIDVADSAPGANTAQSAGLGERESTNFFDFRILTAKPIKMALAQLQLLKRPNDAVLKEQVAKMLGEPAGNEIVIQVSYRSVPPGSSAVHDIHSYFLRSTFAEFRTNTSLASEKSGIVPISRYMAPNDKQSNAAFAFPRQNEKGEPYFTGTEKSITFRSEFAPSFSGRRQKYSIFVKLNPKGMKFQNEFAF
jgi:hypothetical protein